MMFNYLIESSSHVREYKRRGSFLLFTAAVYGVLFVVTGVVAIYAYDARLEQQNLEMVTLISPQEIVPEQPAAVARATPNPPGASASRPPAYIPKPVEKAAMVRVYTGTACSGGQCVAQYEWRPASSVTQPVQRQTYQPRRRGRFAINSFPPSAL